MTAAGLLLVLLFIYYNTHPDEESERLYPSLKVPTWLHCTKWSSSDVIRSTKLSKGAPNRVVSFLWCRRILPGPKLCVHKSKSFEHEVGWWTHIRELHFNGHTHTSLNWGTGKFNSIHSSALTLCEHDANRWTLSMQRIPEVSWSETTGKEQCEKWISHKWKGMSNCITSAQCMAKYVKLNVKV